MVWGHVRSDHLIASERLLLAALMLRTFLMNQVNYTLMSLHLRFRQRDILQHYRADIMFKIEPYHPFKHNKKLRIGIW